MSTVFFLSDLHFGHKRITKFTDELGKKWRQGDNYLENMHIIIQNWNHVVNKRDLVWLLGDTAFSGEGFEALGELNGRKKLVLGNHCTERLKAQDYLKHFETVEGLVCYKGHWLSHAPIHPQELRGRKNIHGHTHHNLVRNSYTNEPDLRYINVCVEWADHRPIPFEEIKSGTYQEKFK